MVIMGVEHSSSLQFESIISEKRLAEDGVIANCMKACESPYEELIPTAEGGICNEEVASTETLDKGYMDYGCSHYRRRCRIRAPCCNEIFDCRHCHNEAKNSICIDQKLSHDMPRHLLEKVVCSLCHTEQEVQQVCRNCGVCMGRYYCGICKLYDDDISKDQYHCGSCGICRYINHYCSFVNLFPLTIGERKRNHRSVCVELLYWIGGSKNFFHCDKCECCYSVLLKSSHPCVERAMHQDCPVCFEYLFESRSDVIAMPCGHTIHRTCLEEMQEHNQYTCPICSKSVCNMLKVWEKYDLEIAATPMPPSYEDKMVWILCNDCGSNSEVKYHIVGQKCPDCKSYNTRQTRGLGR